MYIVARLGAAPSKPCTLRKRRREKQRGRGFYRFTLLTIVPIFPSSPALSGEPTHAPSSPAYALSHPRTTLPRHAHYSRRSRAQQTIRAHESHNISRRRRAGQGSSHFLIFFMLNLRVNRRCTRHQTFRWISQLLPSALLHTPTHG